MITVRVSGPAKQHPHDLGSKIGSMLTVAGKVVRRFRAEPPAEVLDAHASGVDVTIITIEELK